MNQQRSRRFRASQLAQIEHEAADRVAKELAGIVAQLSRLRIMHFNNGYHI